jgi:TonB family protein
MKPPRPRTLHLRAALATLSLLAPALNAYAQDPKPAQTPPGVGVGRGVPGRVSDEERESDGPFRPHEVETKAVITSKPAPVFTDEALDNDAYGTVRLRVVLSSKGLVTNISVVKGLPDGLTVRAIKAAGQIRFTPARRYGHAVSQYATLDYDFFNDEEADRKVEILEQPQPAYTEAARRNRTAGRVVISAYFRKDGTVESRRVLESLPDGLTEKALEALARIKVVPAEIRGRKVTAARKVEYVFSPDAPAKQ